MDRMTGLDHMEKLDLDTLAEVSGGKTQYSKPRERDGFDLYQIQMGETLHSIAAKFGFRVAELLAWNPFLVSRNDIRPGVWIYIRDDDDFDDYDDFDD